MKKNIIVRNITIVALIINTISAVFYVWEIQDIILQKLNMVCWVVSELWLILFVYANCVYVPKDARYVKNRKISKRAYLLSDMILFVAVLYIICICIIRFCDHDYGLFAFIDAVGFATGLIMIADIINRRAEKEFNSLANLLFGKHNL